MRACMGVSMGTDDRSIEEYARARLTVHSRDIGIGAGELFLRGSCTVLDKIGGEIPTEPRSLQYSVGGCPAANEQLPHRIAKAGGVRRC